MGLITGWCWFLGAVPPHGGSEPILYLGFFRCARTRHELLCTREFLVSHCGKKTGHSSPVRRDYYGNLQVADSAAVLSRELNGSIRLIVLEISVPDRERANRQNFFPLKRHSGNVFLLERPKGEPSSEIKCDFEGSEFFNTIVYNAADGVLYFC